MSDQTNATPKPVTIRTVLAQLSSSQASTMIGNLVGIWNAQGLSPEQINRLLDDLKKADEDCAAEMTKLREQLVEARKAIESNDSLIREAQEVIRKIDLDIARLEGRIGARREEEERLANSIAEREQRIRELERGQGEDRRR